VGCIVLGRVHVPLISQLYLWRFPRFLYVFRRKVCLALVHGMAGGVHFLLNKIDISGWMASDFLCSHDSHRTRYLNLKHWGYLSSRLGVGAWHCGVLYFQQLPTRPFLPPLFPSIAALSPFFFRACCGFFASYPLLFHDHFQTTSERQSQKKPFTRWFPAVM
jgi:hypothetical protein